MVKVRYFDKQVHRDVDRKIVDWMNRIGARGEEIAKRLISGQIMPELRAVDTGFLRTSLSWIINPRKRIIRIGTYIARTDGKSLEYAIHVFLGTVKMPARPVLRTMLQMIRVELR